MVWFGFLVYTQSSIYHCDPKTLEGIQKFTSSLLMNVYFHIFFHCLFIHLH